MMYRSLALITIGLCIATFVGSVQIDVSKEEQNGASTTVLPPTTTSTSITTTSTSTSTTTADSVKSVVLESSSTKAPITATTTNTPPVTTALNSTVNITETTTAVPISNITSSVGQSKSTWWYKARREIINRLHVSSDYFCACDLTINLCDLNCCCDIDCSRAMQSSFSCDAQDQTIFDYNWQSMMVPCSLKNGLFCVVRENTVENEFYDPSKRELQTHQWASPESSSFNSVNEDREFYRQHDPILVYHEISEFVEPLTIPAALTGMHCHINLPVRFLSNSQKSTCIRSTAEHNSFVRQLQHRLLNTKLLRTRRGMKNHVMISELCGDDTSSNKNCHPVDIFECVDKISFGTCNKLNDTEYEIDSSFHNHQIVLEFVHNFTNILNGSAYFVYSMGIGRLERQITVRFRQLDELRTPHHSVSGNLGYQLGKPIIISYWTPANASDEHSPMIALYFHKNNTQHDDNSHQHLRIPTFALNECRLDNDTFETIAFGHDIFVKCDVRFARNNTESTVSNFTLLCQQFQTTIYGFILNEWRPKDLKIDSIVSSLGNPKNVSTQWTRMASESDVGLAEIKGDQEDGGFRCRNIVLGVDYEFEWARLRVNSQPHQNRIMAAKVRLANRVDLRFGWDEDVWSVPVFVDAIFMDMTGESSRSIACMWITVFASVFVVVITK